MYLPFRFATRPIMRVYNYMLSKFSLNTLEENEVVMTMMHHVVVDIAKPEVLYQIPILSTFASLWEAGTGYITKVTMICKLIVNLHQETAESLERFVER